MDGGIKGNNQHDNDCEIDLVLDLSSISCTGSFAETLQLKDYSKSYLKKNNGTNTNISEKSPYIMVSVHNKSTIIKKSSLCWLLDQNSEKISTDRLRRFIHHKQGASIDISNEQTYY